MTNRLNPCLLGLPTELQIEIVKLVDDPENVALSCKALYDVVQDTHSGVIGNLNWFLKLPITQAEKIRHLRILPVLGVVTAYYVAKKLLLMPHLQSIQLRAEPASLPAILTSINSACRLQLELHTFGLQLWGSWARPYGSQWSMWQILQKLTTSEQLQSIRIIEERALNPERSHWVNCLAKDLLIHQPTNLRTIVLDMPNLGSLASGRLRILNKQMKEVHLIRTARPHKSHVETTITAHWLLPMLVDKRLLHLQIDGVLDFEALDATLKYRLELQELQTFETAISRKTDDQTFAAMLRLMPSLQRLCLRIVDHAPHTLLWRQLPSMLTALHLTSSLTRISRAMISDSDRLKQIRTACPQLKKLSILILRNGKNCLNMLGGLQELNLRLIVTTPLLPQSKSRRRALQLTALDEKLARKIFHTVFSHVPARLTVDIVCDVDKCWQPGKRLDEYHSLLEVFAVLGRPFRLSSSPDWQGISVARLAPRTIPRAGNAERCRKTWPLSTAQQFRGELHAAWPDWWIHFDSACEVDSILRWRQSWPSLTGLI